MLIVRVGLCALVLALWSTASFACSVTADFVRSTTYEMVERSDAVAVVTAMRTLPGASEHDEEGVRFRIDLALKGVGPAEVDGQGAYIGRTTRSNTDDIAQAHPESFMGPCVRSTFQKGGQYVVFLKRDVGGDGQWQMMRHIFWRDAEDYDGPASLWVEVLKFYIDIQSRFPDRMAALEALAEALPNLERTGATVRQRALASDIRDHLGSLSPWKPTPYLVEAYKALERGQSPRYSVRGPQANREGGPADAVTDLIFDIRHPEFDLERQKESVLRSLVNGEHPEAIGLFEQLLAGHPTSGTLGMAIRYLSNNGQMQRAFELAETEGMRRLGSLPPDEASLLVSDIASAMRGRMWRYEAKNEAWRTSPYVAARWPEMALALFWMDRRAGWGGYSFRDSIDGLRPDDYRVRPEVLIALAEGHDEAVRTWAIEQADRLVPVADWLEDEDLAWLPLRALVVAFGEDRDAALLRAWCRGESGRIMTVQTLGMWGDHMDDGLLKQMLVTPGQDEEALDGIRKALAMIYGRHATDRGGMFSGDEPYEAIKASLTGRRVEDYAVPVLPIVCPAS